jgi:hypothetical protein
MITAIEIRKKAERIYLEVLRSGLTGEIYFPRTIRSDKSLSKDFVAMSQEVATVMSDSKDRKGYGYSVKSEPVRTREHGVQDIPSEIVFETLDDYLKFIGKVKEYELFVETSGSIKERIPKLGELFLRSPNHVIDNFDRWEELLKVCDWFLNYFEPDRFYIRELPISVHSKFIEENKGMLRILLDELIPDKLLQAENDFEKRFGLKYVRPVIRFRFLGRNEPINAHYSDLTVPFDQFVNHEIICAKVIVIENQMNFLTFPKIENAIAIWGKGFALESLKDVSWLRQRQIYYWSDIDAQGFQMLSRLRSHFPQTKSMFMDKEVFAKFGEFTVGGTPTRIGVLQNLSQEENELFNLLCQGNTRLEQERISQDFILKRVYLI